MTSHKWLAYTMLLLLAANLMLGCSSEKQIATPPSSQELPMRDILPKLERELLAQYGEAVSGRLQRGLKQVASFWRPTDGGPADFEAFVRLHFAVDTATRDQLFQRMEFIFESLNGHMVEIARDLRWRSDLDLGTIYPFDELLAGYEPGAHINDDFFNNKLAFVVLLNFPLTTLEERIAQGEKWSRREWAEARLVQGFSKRIPAEVSLALGQASAEAARYISEYNIWMHHLVDDKGVRLFPPKLRLLSHWNLRDQIKADYADTQGGLAKQRLIQTVMEHIVRQSIPAAAINNPGVDWNPGLNTVQPAVVNDGEAKLPATAITAAPEMEKRYATLLKTFHAARKVDPFSPTAPTLIARRFDEARELPESRVQAMFEKVLTSPLVARVAALIAQRLGRPLEPFDIWYNGFRARAAYSETQLDDIVRKKYPTAEAYKADIPNLLTKLSFNRDRAEYLAAHIEVDPARGSGHAWGATRRGDKAHLRTRVEKSGMDYKGFNIAVHEMGHTVEQVFSLYDVDHTLLQGVPNNAFTEAFAFVFQNRDLELLGLSRPDAASRAMGILDGFWNTYEICGVSLVDMGIWHWMYDHPDAKPAELRDAAVEIAIGVWNKYYAPVFNKRDVVLLAIYSHIIDSFLYLPDYAIGHMISAQIEGQIEKVGKIGPEFERMARQGNLTPDLWMRGATGLPVGPDALLEAADKALTSLVKR